MDLRHALDEIPWPAIEGRRCLDIGTWDGFYAFELERRGASEVVAVDLPDLSLCDFPPAVIADPTFNPEPPGTQPRSAGFHLLHNVLNSKVQWQGVNIYDLPDAGLGEFDVVVLGSLLVHLRDPVKALDAVRRVTRGSLVLVDYLHWPLEVLSWKRPLAELRGQGSDFQWWLASSSALRQMLRVAGFDVVDETRPFLLRERDQPRPSGLRGLAPYAAGVVVKSMIARDWRHRGHLHRAFQAKPMFR